jgi:hypothetical protein
MVLKANEVMVASETPLDRVLVSKISAGMIQERGPQVLEKLMLKSQVTMMKPQPAPPLWLVAGGNTAGGLGLARPLF